ncbi:hypothetical protein IFM89_014611 [Coptis chinensis]|uniref:Uncharacterized protein n=1 Tax=Coptis chinensis TaxID=261450 RepID=A0A835IMP5_9MAGN|nr:hypothetical protein IFM89_014611 [Coptis chinensis]
MSYEKTIRALSGHFEGRAMSYEKTIRALSLHFEGMTKSYEKTIRALSLHFEGTAKSYEKTIRELSIILRVDMLCPRRTYATQRKRSFRLAQLLAPFFKSITEQVIPEDLLAVHSEIVRVGESGSDVDVSEDMHCDESASGVQEGANDMSSESDPFLAPTYESEDNADDIEINEQGELINVVNKLVIVPSPVNVRLLDENMPLTTTLPASRGENVEGGIASGHPQVEPEIRNGNSSSPVDNIITSVHAECDMQDMREDVLVKKRSETSEQAALISIDEAAGSTVGPVKKKPDMDKQREIQAIKAGLPNKTCLRRRLGHSSLDVTPELLQPDYNVTVEYRKYQRKYPQKKKTLKETNGLPTKLGATLPLVSDTVVVLGSREPRYPRSGRRKRCQSVRM